jgi:hypothetical protein
VRRAAALLIAIVLCASSVGAPKAVNAATTCQTRSITFTYRDNSDAIFGVGPTLYFKLKLRANMCWDGTKAWQNAAPTWTIESPWFPPIYNGTTKGTTTLAGLAYAWVDMRVLITDGVGDIIGYLKPALRVSAVNGLWYGYDRNSSIRNAVYEVQEIFMPIYWGRSPVQS